MGIPAAGVSQTPPAGDLANAVSEGAFTGTGVSPLFSCWGVFNIFLYGNGGPNGNWSGTVRLERSFDGGNTWIVAGMGGDGTQAQWTSAGTGADISVTAGEPEAGMTYRLNCTAFSSGVINYRMSGTGQAPLSVVFGSVV